MKPLWNQLHSSTVLTFLQQHLGRLRSRGQAGAQPQDATFTVAPGPNLGGRQNPGKTGRTQGKPLLFIPKPQGLNHEILKSFQFFPSMTGIEGEGKAERLRFGTWNIPSPQLKLLLWSGEWTIWVIWVYLDKSPNPPTHHLVGK